MSGVPGTRLGMRTPCPSTVNNRRDAQQLWSHLFERRVDFRLEEDPSEWVDAQGRFAFAPKDIALFRRLVAEVDRLGGEAFDCYDDVERMRQLTMLSDSGTFAGLRAA